MKKVPGWLKVVIGGGIGAALTAGACALFGKKDDAETENETSEEYSDEIEE